MRYHTGGAATASVLTARMRGGDFGELLTTNRIQLYNPLAAGGPAYAGNVLPTVSPNPVVRYLLAHPEIYPLANQAPSGGTPYGNNYLGVTKQRIYNDQYDVKVDYRYREKDTFFVRWTSGLSGDTNTQPLAIQFPTASSYPTKSVAINFVHTFSPRIQNEARVGFLRTVWHQGIPADTTGLFGNNTGNATVGIAGGSFVPGFSAQTVSGLTTIGNSAIYSDNLMNNFTYGDNLTVQKGAHIIKLGAQFIRYQQNSVYTGNDGAQGNLTYNGNFTSRAGNGTAPAAGISDVGSPLGDFYLNRVFSAGRGTLAGHTGQRQWRDAWFLQDDWKAFPTLTVNLGLRWEFDQPIYEVNNKQSNVDLTTGALQLAGVNGNSRALYKPVYTNFMPRIGFSWNPTPRFVIRGGYGTTTYLEGTGANLRLTINPPFQSSFSFSGAAPTAGNVGSSTTADTAFSASSATCAYATNPACGQTIRAWDPNLRPSTVQAVNLTTEYQLSNTSSFQIGYVNEYAYHLIQAVRGNQLARPCFNGTTLLAYNSAACFAANKSPFYALAGQSGFVQITRSGSMMNYNALQATFRQRVKNGLQFTANYAYSRSLTNSIGFYGVSGVNNNSAYAENPNDNSQEYGPAGTDATHNVNFNLTYDLPVGRGRMFGGNMNRVFNEVVGGWKVAMTGFIYSGFPTTISTTNINSGVNSAQQRLIKYRNIKYVNRSVNNWFGTDPSAVPCLTAGVDNGVCAYGQPANGTLSPQRPGTERVPGYQQYDASVFKNFAITEHQYLSLRADGSNVLNIASYGNPDRVANSSTFGRITTTRSGPRQLQLSVKYVF